MMQASSRVALAASLVVLALCAGCSKSLTGEPDLTGGRGEPGASGDLGGSGGIAPGPSTGGGSDAGTPPRPGQLTAADWDDNLNFSFFSRYANEYAQANASFPAQPGLDRVVISVRSDDGAPLSGAVVTVSSGASSVDLLAGSDGRAIFLPGRDGLAGGSYTVTVRPSLGEAPIAVDLPAPPGAEWSFELSGAPHGLPGALDVAFIVDTTGSMGDEIAYLKAEIGGIADAVRASFPGASIRYGLVVYRDNGDEYLTRKFDLSEDFQAFQSSLFAQNAGGGGDYPEAMEKGAAEMNSLSWRGGNVARVAFLVADAPPHTENGAAFFNAVNSARLSGLRVYPVAASGAGDDAEYFLRGAAQVTGARYLFLTDDSGIGDTHQVPHIPCYQVQLMSKLVVRMIQSEMTGTRVPMPDADVVRSVGSPQGGVCTLPDGTQARF